MFLMDVLAIYQKTSRKIVLESDSHWAHTYKIDAAELI